MSRSDNTFSSTSISKSLNSFSSSDLSLSPNAYLQNRKGEIISISNANGWDGENVTEDYLEENQDWMGIRHFEKIKNRT